MTIKKLRVENVKGAKVIEIVHDIIPNKPTLLVAPNGFGKTSITTAFARLNAKRLKLEDGDLHDGDVANKPRLCISLQSLGDTGVELIADENSNTISGRLDIHVINSRLRPKATKRKMGPVMTATARLTLDEIILVNKIPKKVYFPYSVGDVRKNFGTNGKCLPNIGDDLSSGVVAGALLGALGILSKYGQARIATAMVSIIGKINTTTGTAPEILAWAAVHVSADLEALSPIKTAADLIGTSCPATRSRTELLLAAIEICQLHQMDATRFKAACEYVQYLSDRAAYDQLIGSFNTTKKVVRSTERKGKLLVEFPEPSAVSNGQRDSLSFAAQIQHVRGRLGTRDIVLVVDEIFDYLDDANLVAAQYYIVNLIKEVKSRGARIYPLIFTHLDPQLFRSYAFADQKVIFIDKRKATINPAFRKLLVNRSDKTIEAGLDRYFLHYEPAAHDLTREFKALGIHEAWGDSVAFAAYTDAEWKKYDGGAQNYDPFAICCFVRVGIERQVYLQLPDAQSRADFVNVHTTSKKLKFALTAGVNVPDTCFLLGLIYNDGLHVRNNSDDSSPAAARLGNVVIHHMIHEALAG